MQAKLARVVQAPEEKVSEYALRVTQIYQKIVKIINEGFDSIMAQEMIEGTTGSAVECLILGLRHEIASLMIGKRPTTLEAAINAAIDAERDVGHRQELLGTA